MKIIEENHKYEYGCVMAVLSPSAAKLVRKLGNTLIPNEYLYNEPGEEYGREKEPHITILFGLTKQYTKEGMRKVVSYIKPFSVLLTKIDMFQCEKYDVVKINVESKVLMKLNKIFSRLPYTTDHPEYHPHMTIAYVKKGTANNFLRDIEPVQVDISKIKYSSPNEKYFYDLV